jgi:regulator of sigma E protease
MSQSKGPLNKNVTVFLTVAAFVAVVYLIILNLGVFGNILLVALGFGAVVLVHEFGHFIAAKLSDIKVEAFSIGFPPILLGIMRTENGWRIRILPQLFKKEDGSEGALNFTIGRKTKPGETEYRVGLLPFGGFVKMLGQDDVAPATASDDPRSFLNKPILSKMAVVAAGVVSNALSAVIVFMVVFLIGINLIPPIVGGVLPGSPAAMAGIKPGDEVIEIAGESDDLDFANIGVAAALSATNEKVPLKIKHKNGLVENFAIAAEKIAGEKMKSFGIESPASLTISEVSDADELLKETGLLPGDKIKDVNGQSVQSQWELEQIVRDTLSPTVTISAQRHNEIIQSQIKLNLDVADREIKSEADLCNICSMVPRLKVNSVLGQKVSLQEVSLQDDDVILAVGNVENPTYKELRDIVGEYENKELAVKVLRKDANGVERVLTATAVPKRWPNDDRAKIGIGVVYDAEHPVVAKTIAAENGPPALDIPRGAVITAVNGTAVSNFYDIIREIDRNKGQRVTIKYCSGEKTTGGVDLDVAADKDFISVKSSFAEVIPLKPMDRLYKADTPVKAIGMGYRKTVMFIAQAYVTVLSA